MNPPNWQRAPESSLEQWDGYVDLAVAARRDGLTRFLVCGMGGSSLVAHVLATIFGIPDTRVLDSTNPAAVRAAGGSAADLARTLFVVASKSGNTVETLAFCRYFATRARPDQFIAITEPDTPLDEIARARGFRAVIPHPPGIGGRYSALTAIGMVPAALMRIDGRVLLERTLTVDIARAQQLGAAIAKRVKTGHDKLLLIPPPRVAALGQWIEQLVAESSGKDGRGVVPVVDDPVGAVLPDMQMLGAADFSADPLDIGAEFFRWEYATTALCDGLGVNAFDQPDVEEAKQLARAELAGLRAAHIAAAPPLAPPPTLSLAELTRRAKRGDYFAILAYLPPTAELFARLQRLRAAWGRKLACATTLGFGPRYLHSTGQLHKGGPNTGLFLVITAADGEDIEIPEMGLTFGQLHQAQARGDVRALVGRGRRVAHVHLSSLAELEQLHPPS
jgi:hypothetical protein